jgi:hypothetical protein
MKKHMLILSIFLVAVVALILGASAPEGWAQCEEFDEFEVFIEINATDLDAGLQGMLDGEAWNQATVRNPNDEPIFSFEPGGTLAEHGVTEIQWESNEPPFKPSKEAEPNYNLDDFLELFEEGVYTASGTPVEGGCLESETELTHDLPAGPHVTSHEEDEEVVRGSDLIVTWDEVTKEFDPKDPQGQKQNASDLDPEIVAYIVVAEYDLLLNAGTEDEEEITRVLTIDVAADVPAVGYFSVVIPADFLPDEPEPGNELEFKIEVGAVEESGNRTFTEIPLEFVD